MRRSTLVPLLATLAAASVLLAGCSSGPTAEATSLVAKVSVSSGKSSPELVSDKRAVAVGDVVSTAEKGLAQVVYADKSITRVGPSSSLKIVRVSDASTQRTVTKLDVGQTWHRVTKLVGKQSEFTVQTPVGDASVRGTAFSVECTAAPSCEVIVLEGQVDFTTKDGTLVPIRPYERLVVPAKDGSKLATTVYPSEAVQSNAWLKSNLSKDSKAGKATVAGPKDQNADSLAGTYDFEATITAVDNIPGQAVGSKAVRLWTIDPISCTATCGWKVHSSSGNEFTLVAEKGGVNYEFSGLTGCYSQKTGKLVAKDVYTYSTSTKLTVQKSEGSETGKHVTSLAGTLTTDYAATADGLRRCPHALPDAHLAEDVTVTRTK